MTTTQRWVFEKPRGGRGQRRGQGGFSSRLEGAGLRRIIWLCASCRRWHEREVPAACPSCHGRETLEHDGKTICASCRKPRKATRPAQCQDCGETEMLKCDSAVEAQHFLALWLAQDAGEVRGLRHHPRFPLVALCPNKTLSTVGYYEADAQYERRAPDGTWEPRVDDVKPRSEQALDPLFRWKRKHVEAQYGIEIHLVKRR